MTIFVQTTTNNNKKRKRFQRRSLLVFHELVITRTKFTRQYLLEEEKAPICELCKVHLTVAVKHVSSSLIAEDAS